MNNENIQRILSEIADLVAMKPVTLTPDEKEKQFLFVGFTVMLAGYDFQPLTLETVIGYIKNNDMKMAQVVPSVRFATVTDISEEGHAVARIEEMLSGKLTRLALPYPTIKKGMDPNAFIWKTTVDSPDQFVLSFPTTKSLNVAMYDLLYTLYVFAEHNDLLGLYGPAVVNQIVLLLNLPSEFGHDLYDKLLGLSHVLNDKKKTVH